MPKSLLATIFCVCSAWAQDSSGLVSPVLPMKEPVVLDKTFDWRPALNESVRFLFVQHGLRLAFQPNTRKRLGGPFFRDYADSVKATGGWSDGDPAFINYFGHPLQGAITGYIQVQNDPGARKIEFGASKEYWSSRLRALAWNTAYSTQFEIGPISESSLGNVGQRKGTSGYVDFVITPSGGFAWMIAEDWLDKRFIQRLEQQTESIARRRFYRIALNPARAFANVLRGKPPSHRDGRALVPPTAPSLQAGKREPAMGRRRL